MAAGVKGLRGFMAQPGRSRASSHQGVYTGTGRRAEGESGKAYQQATNLSKSMVDQTASILACLIRDSGAFPYKSAGISAIYVSCMYVRHETSTRRSIGSPSTWSPRMESIWDPDDNGGV